MLSYQWTNKIAKSFQKNRWWIIRIIKLLMCMWQQRNYEFNMIIFFSITIATTTIVTEVVGETWVYPHQYKLNRMITWNRFNFLNSFVRIKNNFFFFDKNYIITQNLSYLIHSIEWRWPVLFTQFICFFLLRFRNFCTYTNKTKQKIDSQQKFNPLTQVNGRDDKMCFCERTEEKK